jgi:hypothetical protein
MSNLLLILAALLVSLHATTVGWAQDVLAPVPVEVAITEWGCDSPQYTLPTGSAPEVLVRNLGDESMVFAVIDFDQLVRVAPGQQVTMPLQSFVWGTFNYLCMTEAAHDAVMGPIVPNQFNCGLDGFALRPRALSEGKLIIEPHGRLQEIEAGRAP